MYLNEKYDEKCEMIIITSAVTNFVEFCTNIKLETKVQYHEICNI